MWHYSVRKNEEGANNEMANNALITWYTATRAGSLPIYIPLLLAEIV